MFELNTSIIVRKAPIYRNRFFVPSLLPGFDLVLQCSEIRDTLVQGMLTQHTQFDLGPI
jgi:hypothetical protein